MTELIKRLDELKIEYRQDEPMSSHTTFGIGGNADLFVEVKTVEELSKVIDALDCSAIPYTVIGNGSNLLVSDLGIDGAVIKLTGIDGITEKDGKITVGAGAKLISLCKYALDKGLSGLEFAYGIPGTVGGAVFMNAGAYGGEMKNVISEVTCLEGGRVLTLSNEQCELGYRTSVFKKNGAIILSVTFELKKGNKDEIKATMSDLLQRRKDKQPLDKKSAGSTFKRPEGYYAAALIDECGLKGFSVGDAEVSTKHAGFVVNNGSASCNDVLCLIEKVKATVLSKTGVTLEPEVILTGRREG